MTTITFEQIAVLPKAFHLVRLDADKAPKWGWKDPHSKPQLQQHMEAGGLVGCLPHAGGFAVIDVDSGRCGMCEGDRQGPRRGLRDR